MVFKNVDFDADNRLSIQKYLRPLYLDVDVTLFWQVEIPSSSQNFDELLTGDKVEAKREVKQKNDLIGEGKRRNMKKVKEVKQSFSKAVFSGCRSDSGKLVFEYYDN